jgi:flagellar hook-basal body complex protein FliE
MEMITRNQARGSDVKLETTSSLHFNDKGNLNEKSDAPKDSFSQVLFNAIDSVNTEQTTSDDLEEKMVLNPEAVDIHEVMIASEKARLSVSFLKSISEKAIRAYNDIMMIR